MIAGRLKRFPSPLFPKRKSCEPIIGGRDLGGKSVGAILSWAAAFAHAAMFAGKSLGTKYRADGYTPKRPVIIVPGLCSSCLKVTESPFEAWVGKRIWLSMSSIGFEKMWSPFGPAGGENAQTKSSRLQVLQIRRTSARVEQKNRLLMMLMRL